MSEGWDDETRKCFLLMAQEQEEDRSFHYALVAEVSKHPERSMSENLDAVERRFKQSAGGDETMSYEQHPWEREDEEIREAFANKNAEIKRLTDELEEKEQDINRLLGENSKQRNEIDRLESEIIDLQSGAGI